MRHTKETTLILLFATFLYYCSAQKAPGLRTKFEWKELEYNFPTNADRTQAIKDGLYVHGNGLPYDVDVYYDDKNTSKIFVTVPRFNTGIPSSMNTVSNVRGEGGPQLMPYPDYTWHKSHGEDCDGMTSICRVAIDQCNRIWLLDTGRIGKVQHCSPQLLVFDLRTDALIRRYRFPQSQFKATVSLFATPTVDVRDPPPYTTCQNTMVYIADLTGFAIVAYDYDQNTSWRIENKLMYPTPECGTFTIAGESFDLMAGIISIALTPQLALAGQNKGGRHFGGYGGSPSASKPSPSRDSSRKLYFHSLSGETENMVPLELVDNRTIWINSPDARPRDFVTIGRRGTQSGPAAMDSRGNMYFGLEEDLAITSWNINTPYNRQNFKLIDENRTTLQFVSGVKVIRNGMNSEELWVVSNRLQKEYLGSKNSQEVNFYILGSNIHELLSGDRQNVASRDNFAFPKYS